MMKVVGYPVTVQHDAGVQAAEYLALRTQLAEHVFAQALARTPEGLSVR